MVQYLHSTWKILISIPSIGRRQTKITIRPSASLGKDPEPCYLPFKIKPHREDSCYNLCGSYPSNEALSKTSSSDKSPFSSYTLCIYCNIKSTLNTLWNQRKTQLRVWMHIASLVLLNTKTYVMPPFLLQPPVPWNTFSVTWYLLQPRQNNQ